MKLEIPEEAALVLGRLDSAGLEGWCVGGCVRDSLLGLEPADWDITTSAEPGKIKELFADLRTLDTGLAHGTVTVLCGEMPIEVTTYRADGDYLDHRHPSGVRFSQRIEDDLSRRDLTVNAMAYHPKRGLCDLFGGQEDLERRVLRCVGEPNRRFEEDALRILRCLRFAATLGFAIEQETGKAARKKRELLGFVSTERIREELYRLLCGRDAERVLGEYEEILLPLLPTLLPMANRRVKALHHAMGTEAALRLADRLGDAVPDQQKEVQKLRRVIESETKLQLCDLAVGGKDLLALGVPHGRELGVLLNRLLEEVRCGNLPNERAALLAACERMRE